MSPRRKVSSSLLLTLAEFAWLIVFALLLLMRGKDNDMRTTIDQLTSTRQDLTTHSNLVEKLSRENAKLKDEVSGYTHSLGGMTPQEALGLKTNLSQTRAELTNALAQLAAKLEAYSVATSNWLYFSNQLAALPPDLQQLPDQFAKLKEQYQNLDRERGEATNRTAKLQQDLIDAESREFVIRREITGLPSGRIKRVVILLDTSSSMQNSTAWDDAKRLVRVWLTYLPIEECVLVNFNSEVQVFPPPKEGFLRLRDSTQGVIAEKQALLLATLDQIKLGTYTDTLTAFKTAYSFQQVDLILLFTDGRPKTQFEAPERLVPKIYALVDQHKSIPILAVGLGDYEQLEHADKSADVNLQIQFLKNLAKRTGGVFMGR